MAQEVFHITRLPDSHKAIKVRQKSLGRLPCIKYQLSVTMKIKSFPSHFRGTSWNGCPLCRNIQKIEVKIKNTSIFKTIPSWS